MVGLNEYTNANRRNRYAGAQMKKNMENWIKEAIRKQLKTEAKPKANQKPVFQKPVKVTFKWFEPDKRRDLDNVCFAKKFILDSLVSMNVIKTDGWKGVAGFTDEFAVDPANPRIEVEINEA